MKTAILLAAILFVLNSYANRESGAGSVMAADFAATGRLALRILSHGDSDLDINFIDEEISRVKIQPKKEVCSGKEYCYDAQYNAVINTIFFDSFKWPKLFCLQKLVISSHEYLRASGLEGEDYKYSSRFFNMRRVVQLKKPVVTHEDQIKLANRRVDVENYIEEACRQIQRSAYK